MEVIILKNADECSIKAAKIAAHHLRKLNQPVFGFPTGKTPLKFYEELIRMHHEDGLDFGHMTSFNLDEYVGIGATHAASYRSFMENNFFKSINVNDKNIHIPDGLAEDINKECLEYENKIKSCGGIDLQFVGIGANGHIAFNEPSSSLVSRTRVKTLTEKTRHDNSPDFGGVENVPMHVITMGIGTIMEARQIVMLAFGSGKSDAIKNMVEGPVSASCPASILQMHQKATIIIDEAAAVELTKTDYYKWVYANRPDWQRIK